MRLARVLHADAWRSAIVSGDGQRYAILPAALGAVDDIVRRGAEALVVVRDALPGVEWGSIDDVRLGAPLTRFNRDILATGWNYDDHFYESAGKRGGQDPVDRPQRPTFFGKAPETVLGPYDDLAFDPDLSNQWDYEVEVAIVLGRDGRSISEERAWDHVFGVCVANDVSLRDLQRAHGGQWLKGKSIDATMPLGPWITTVDELEDPYDLRLQCELNGQIMQDASTSQVAFRFERLIAEVSEGMTLRAGDVLLTGTPSGIGSARNPPVFLAEGDVLVSRVSGLGELCNRVTGGAWLEARPEHETKEE